MENNSFLTQLKELEKNKKIEFDQIKGIVSNLEQIDYNLYKLSVIIEKVQYDGLFIENIENLPITTIFINGLCLIKENGKIKIQINPSGYTININEIPNSFVQKNEIKNNYDLSVISKLLNIINKNEKYDYGIFFYKSKKDNLIVLETFEELNQIVVKVSTDNEFCLNEIEKFFNNLSNGNMIYIENFLVKNDKIEFNNFTSYYLVDGEYLAKYFKKKYNREESYYKQNVYYDINIIQKYESNYLKSRASSPTKFHHIFKIIRN